MTFDFSPGAQIPRTDGSPQTAVTAALSSGAYRDGSMDPLVGLNEATAHKPGRYRLFAPDFGEAFCQAVLARTLGAGRKPLVRSFGIDPRIVVEHCLEAEELRHQRDKQLTVVSLVFGLLFLPGTLVWLAAFEFRRRSDTGKQSWVGSAALVVAVLIGGLLAWHPFLNGFGGIYLRIVMVMPLIGWFVAQRICVRTSAQLRSRWEALIDGGAAGPMVPGAVPIGPEDTKAEELRKNLTALVAEQETNYLHYAGRKGILGLGPRWGSWQMAEQLDPRAGLQEYRPFHPWDVIRKIEERLNRMSRSGVATGGIPSVRVENWVVQTIGEGADEVGRPSGAEMDGSRMRASAVTDIANRQQFGRSPRHYLGVQFVLWDGQLVVTLLITVTVFSDTLRIEVTGHALGPLPGALTGKPKAPTKSVPKTGKFWEETTKNLPIVTNQEVVRLAVRAPFTWTPTLLNWLGGSLKLPEPFGLRSAWADQPWGNRFMADDALRVAPPVLRAVHAATLDVLADHDVEIDRFKNRSMMLGAEVQGARPSKADDYDA
ncbi:hypothetical protein [Streptacidiphilus sp. P02-A3a]|uniref:hypothetical protein n=1 Tax=Streptacidiphilus sp. P02-A3a TaxID=2704468 RepID=UPI0015F9F262|nr:hypothetical protein [Streptacidiphilus sp. P02-A3a]QMU73788.1 hypothetical protein GXP74_14015 [Streptacidiphilus sp. P02-A3a]